MTHQEAYELLESLAFGTLESEEAAEVEVHLESGCPDCIARYRDLTELSVHLASSLPQHEPPPRIKSRLMEQVRGSSPGERTIPSRRASYSGWITAAIAASVAVFLMVQNTRIREEVARWSENLEQREEEMAALKGELDQRHEAHATLERDLAESREETDSLRGMVEEMRDEYTELQRNLTVRQEEIETMRRDLAAYEDATLLLGQPGMQFVDLDGVEPNAQAFGKVVIDPNRGTGIVYMYRLPQQPEGMEYQLWVLREGKPTSVGTFTVADDGSAMLSMKSLPSLTEIASFRVTIEPEGGMPEPTGMMYLTGPDVP